MPSPKGTTYYKILPEFLVSSNIKWTAMDIRKITHLPKSFKNSRRVVKKGNSKSLRVVVL